jgi:carbamoyltransferase
MKLYDSQYNILGIIGGTHSCGVAYVEKGNVVAVLEEERLTRVKPWKDFEADFWRYPLQGLHLLKTKYDVNFNNIDYVTSFLEYNVVKNMLKSTIDFDLPEDKFIKTEHHETHCALAYYLSGFKDDTLVIAIDGSGEYHSSKYYLGSNGEMKYIDGISIYQNSLGMFYAAITELLGFKRLKDEGKVVGMAAHGELMKDIYDALDKVVTIEGLQTNKSNYPGSDSAGGDVFLNTYKNFFEVVGSRCWKNPQTIKNIAYTAQLLFENKILELVDNIHKIYPDVKKLALSGGIFANVKLNKKINELDWVNEVFITPPMGDEGLMLGSIIVAMKQLHPYFHVTKLPNVYFGNEYKDYEINEAARSVLGTYNYIPYNIDFVTSLLLNKKILGLYQGKSEHGPRALGNRSIICEATNPETYDIINGKLQRNDYMPFAPAVLDEDANTLFQVNKSAYTAEFMTMLYDTQPEWADKLPTVTHPKDKTARIQIVTEDSNLMFHQILKSYKEKTGFGCLVNTSFNVHNEPIVDRPEEAFTHLKNGIIDYLITPYGIYSK